MKNYTIKRSISLLLILTFGMVSFISFPLVKADEEVLSKISIPEIEDSFESGKIIVGLKEVYLGDLDMILPEIQILEYTDLYQDYVASIIAKEGEISEYMQTRINKEFVVTLTENTKQAVIDALSVLMYNPYIKYAQANTIYRTLETIPNDEHYYNPSIPSMQWGHLKIETSRLWDYITGGDILVGVLDTGIDYFHPDLNDNVEMSLAKNVYNPLSNNVFDYDGHGTQVAGVIGAEGNNEIGVAGVAWDVKVVPIKITDDNPENVAETNATAFMNAMVHLMNNEIMIANYSYSLGEYDSGVEQSIELYSEMGGILILSAGNYPISLEDYETYTSISDLPGVIIVGGLEYSASDDIPWAYSAYGGNTVHIFAPGEAILTTTTFDGLSYVNAYVYQSGTSFAAPFVTGVVALLKLANPTLPNHIIKNAIINGAVYSSYLDGKCVADGRLDALGAFNAIGKRITVAPGIENGSVTASGIVSPSNRSVMVTVDPDPGYWLKPGSLVYHYSAHYVGSISSIALNYYYFTMPNAHVTITAEFYMIGDVNLDGVIDISDALAALRHASGQEVLTGDAFLAADVNGDGSVTQADSNIILNYYSGAIDSFPIEG